MVHNNCFLEELDNYLERINLYNIDNCMWWEYRFPRVEQIYLYIYFLP